MQINPRLPLAKWLETYVCSHTRGSWHTIGTDKLYREANMKGRLRRFRSTGLPRALKELERIEQTERGYIDRGRQIEGIERALSTSEKDREAERKRADEAEADGREKDTKIAALEEANTQSQKMLDEAGKTEQQQKADIELLKQDQRVYREAYDKQDGENALLREALDNYKQADLARDLALGRGHEKG